MKKPLGHGTPVLPILWFTVVLALFSPINSSGLVAQTSGPVDLSDMLEEIRAQQDVPGLVAAMVVGDQVVAIGACGKRKAGADEPMTIDDKLHLGSCTKAMTVTMLATLVADDELQWTDKPTDVWESLSRNFHEAYRDVTLDDLLAHRAGVKKDVRWWRLPGRSPRLQRANLVKEILSEAPEGKHGEYLYSNVGYAIAGAMAERITGQDWEQLMRTRLFEPLGMDSAGFGPPSIDGNLDQPWGHILIDDTLTPVQNDNAPSLGPAGTVHMSIRDWGKFAALHLQTHPERTKVLSDTQIQELHQIEYSQDDNPYGFGWIHQRRWWAGGTALTHTGSNTSWHATIWLAPKRQVAFLAVTNTGTENAHVTCDQAIVKMLDLWRADFSK